MVVAAIDEGDVDGQMSEAARGVEAGEAAADDEDAGAALGRQLLPGSGDNGGLGHGGNLLLLSSRCDRVVRGGKETDDITRVWDMLSGFVNWQPTLGFLESHKCPEPEVRCIISEEQPQILRLTTPKLKYVWGPVRSG